MASLDDLRSEALAAAERYAAAAWEESGPFRRGVDPVSVAGKVAGPAEARALVDAALDGWFTEGRWAHAFRERLTRVTGRGSVALVGSGSQANLLAVAAARELALAPGDEVITPAVGFPTTVTPLYQQGLRPVYVDVDLATGNPTLETVLAARGPRTKAVLAAHCLGNPYDAPGIVDAGLLLIEDCCDALGSKLDGRLVGTFGAAATYSFYPAHHMTTGEGGAVAVDDPDWARAVTSLREWGRDCWCPPGRNDVCGRRFEGRFGGLPEGYDHKYVFSRVGYNLKVTDFQCALGLAQTERLSTFAERRRDNFARLYAALAPLADRLVLPATLPRAEPNWFGFPLVLREGGARERTALQRFLLERRIDSRLLLAGNMTRQPGFQGLDHRVAGSLRNADRLTQAGLWVGCHHGLEPEHVDWIAESVVDFAGPA